MLHNNSEDPPHEILLQKNPISFKYEWNITVPSKWKNGPKYTKRQSIKLLDE